MLGKSDNSKTLGLVNGEYRIQDRSQALPIITGEIIRRFLLQAREMGETSWAKAVRQWVRELGA
jgi:hypothetical protein